MYPKPHIPPLRDQAVERVTICIGAHKFSPHNGAMTVSTSCSHSTALLLVQRLPAKRSAHLQSNMEASFDIGYNVCAEAGDENNKISQPENELKSPVCGRGFGMGGGDLHGLKNARSVYGVLVGLRRLGFWGGRSSTLT